MSPSITSPPRLLAALVVALALGACGGDPAPIRPETASRLQEDLDKVALAIDAGQCGRSVDAPLKRLERNVGNLDEIDGGVQDSLQDGVDRLAELAQQECDELEAAESTTTEPETTSTETTTTEPETTSTETTTTEPETTSTETTTTTPTEPAPTTPPETPTTAPQPGDGGQGTPEDGGAAPSAGGADG